MTLTLGISYSGVLGGAERTLLDFLSGLEGELCLACPEGALAAEARDQGLRLMPMRRRRLSARGSVIDRALAAQSLARHSLEARALVRNLDPDLVIACGMRSAIALLAGSRSGPPTVFLHHDMVPGGVVGRIVRATASTADLVVVPSRAVADDLDGATRPVDIH